MTGTHQTRLTDQPLTEPRLYHQMRCTHQELEMKCPRCKSDSNSRIGVCSSCGADFAFAYKVNLAAGAVILAAGVFLIALSAVETTISFLPIGLAELAVGLFVGLRAAAGLRSLALSGISQRMRKAKDAAA